MFLYYDGTCRFCARYVAVLQWLGLLHQVTIKQIDPERDPPQLLPYFQESSQLYDETSGARFDKLHVVVELIRRRFHWLNLHPLLEAPVLGVFLVWCFNLLAPNRHILLPNAQHQQCRFGPGPTRKSRSQLMIVLLIGAFAGSMIFGAAIGLHHEAFRMTSGGLRLILAAGAGWALSLIVFAVIQRKRFLDITMQCLVVMNIGIFWLMPTTMLLILIHPLQPEGMLVKSLVMGGVMLDAAIMARSFFVRATALNFPKWVAPAWFIMLQAGGLPLLFYFDLLGW